MGNLKFVMEFVTFLLIWCLDESPSRDGVMQNRDEVEMSYWLYASAYGVDN